MIHTYKSSNQFVVAIRRLHTPSKKTLESLVYTLYEKQIFFSSLYYIILVLYHLGLPKLFYLLNARIMQESLHTLRQLYL